MSNTGPKENKIQLPAWAVTIGYAGVKALSVPPTQWISIIASNQKKRVANLHSPLSFVAMGKKLVAKEGKKVLVKGSLTSMVREFGKGLWKVPFQTGAEYYSQKIINAINPHWKGKDKDVAQGLMTGFGAGTADAFAAAPFERIKIYIMTSGKPIGFWGAIYEIYGQHQQKPAFGRLTGFVNEMWLKGIGPTIIKQSAMLSTVAITRPWVNSALSPYKKDNPKATAFFAAFIPGACAAVVSAIPDLKKIKDQSIIGGKSESFFKFIRLVYAKNGMKAFSGVPGTIVLTAFGYTLNTAALNIFDEYVKKDNDSSSPPPSTGGRTISESSPISNDNNIQPENTLSNVEALSWESLISGFNNLTFSQIRTTSFSDDIELELELDEKMSKLNLRS